MKTGLTTHWTVKLGARALPPTVQAYLVELEVSRQLHHADRFCLKFSDPELALVDGTTFPLGAAVQITLTHGGQKVLVFDGELTAWGLERTEAGTLFLVRGLDRSHRLVRGQKVRYVEVQNDGGIVRALAREHGLQAQADGAQGRPGQLQLGSTDLELLRSRGARFGQPPEVEGKQLGLKKLPEQGLPVQLPPEARLSRFMLGGELSGLPTRVEVVSWDFKRHQRVQGRAAATQVRWAEAPPTLAPAQARRAFGEGLHFLADLQPASASEARALATAYLKSKAEEALEGVVWVAGFPAVTPGERLRIDEPSFPLPGIFRVLGVVYLLTPAGGMTRLEVSRPHLLSRTSS